MGVAEEIVPPQIGSAPSGDVGVCWQGRALVLARMVWAAVALLSVALYLTSLGPTYAAALNWKSPHMLNQEAVRAGLTQLGLSIQLLAVLDLCTATVSMLAFVGVGTVIFWRKGEQRSAWFFALALVTFGVDWPNTLPLVAQVQPALWPAVKIIDILGFGTFFWLNYTFPDGRFVPRWTRPVAIVFLVLVALIDIFPGTPLDYNTWPSGLMLATGLGLFGTMIYAPVHRYRHASTPAQRQQIKWVLFSLVIAVACFAITAPVAALPLFKQPGPLAVLAFLASNSIYYLSFALIPLAIGMAILRYRLWDIDFIISRTLVYGTLTVLVVGGYVAVVAGLGRLLRLQGGLPLSLVATGLIAVVFQPVRERVQRGVNRLLYGERDDPYQVLRRLGQDLKSAAPPATALPLVAQTIAGALRLPYVGVALKQDGRFQAVAQYGTPQGEVIDFPLSYGQEEIGQLSVCRRTPNDPLTPADRRFLHELSAHISIAAHSALLTAELERSRLSIVAAREESRRHLGNDLHDGVGHQLAAVARQIERTAEMLEREPARARELLEGIARQVSTTMSLVRGLAHQLHPPELELLGLVGALREQAQTHTSLSVQVDVREALPRLPTEVETAAYYIALEALSNAERHAEAKSLHLRLTLTEGESVLHSAVLALEITDDGIGLPMDRAGGLGLLSMQERAAELGGTYHIERPVTGGSRILVRLPCHLGPRRV